MFTLLKKPYPITSDYRKRLLSIFLISLFVFLFLYIFQPFGLYRINNSLSVTLAYGAVTFIIGSILSVLVPMLFPSFFMDEEWTTGKETVFTLFLIACIATGNMWLGYFFGFQPFSLKSYLNILLITMSVAAIPVFVAVISKQNYLLRKNLDKAKQLSAELNYKKRLGYVGTKTVTIHAENPKDDLQLPPENIYLLKAAENYVEVYYGQDILIEKKLLRTTLKSVHDDLKIWSRFYRCHRTCIINLEKVERVTGNAQGYRLILTGIEETVPVSRTLNKDITMRLKR